MGRLDTALICLVTVAKMLGIPAEQGQMKRAYAVGSEGMDVTTLLRAAKELGLKARIHKPEQEKLVRMPLPLILRLTNDNFIVVVRVEGDKCVISDPYKEQLIVLPVASLLKGWSGEVILVTRRAEIAGVDKKFGLSWFAPVVWRYKKLFGEVLVLSLLLQLFGLASPLFTQVIIDNVLVHRSLGTLDILLIGMMVVAIFQSGIMVMRNYLFSHTTSKVDVVLSTKLFRHITALPIKYFSTWQVGDVVSRVKELDNIRQFMTGSALTVVLDIVFAVVYIIMMVKYNVILSAFALLALPMYVLLNAVVTPIYKNRLNKRFAAGTETQAFLIETITGIQTVKSMATEPVFIQKWERMLANYITTSFNTANLANIAGNIGGFLQQFFNLGILWIGASLVMDNKLTIGELIAFQMLAGQVVSPVLRLVNMWQYFQQTMVSVDRLGDILNDEVEPIFNPNRTTLPAVTGEIVFERVTFRYRADMAEVLHQLSFHIKAGSKVGIVGRSGSGKSTLAKLLQRLYVPESGRALIDGIDLAQVEPAWLRRQIGVVLQENYLFSGSIKENIVISKQEATEEEMIHAATIAGVHEFVQCLPGGYDTAVGERGTALSGGQRQRVAIARALINNPSIVIFDEATSALDYESERIIMDNLEDIAVGRTMVMIAHRLSTVRKCDTIIVMERGKITEMGNHDELMTQQGMYYDLYQQQENM